MRQFYLVWPALILIGHRLVRQGLPLLILGIGAASLIAAQMKLGTDPAAAFYLPIYRAYEFAIGALVIFASGGAASLPRDAAAACRGRFWPDRLAHLLF